MKSFIITIPLVCLFYTTIFSQTDIAPMRDSVEREGRALYRSEMASWYGTDILVDKLKDRQEDIGGYFSYAHGDSATCVFFDKGDSPLALATISFDSSYKVANASVDALPRKLTDYENVLYAIRKAALSQINKDTLFKTYKNTNLNLVPLVNGNEKKVYVLTGPEQNGVVIFGNDYLLMFDDGNNVIAKKRLHKNILFAEYANTGESSFGGMHSHLSETGDLITPTDICTLMLYEKFAKWQQYIVMSENYISIWDCNNNRLVVLTTEAWKKINQDQGKKHSKN